MSKRKRRKRSYQWRAWHEDKLDSEVFKFNTPMTEEEFRRWYRIEKHGVVDPPERLPKTFKCAPHST